MNPREAARTPPPAPAAAVAGRHVLFFGGFDPKGASYYHAIYSRHAARQARVNGLQIAVGRRQRDGEGHMYWDATATDTDGAVCESRIENVGWDGLVRRFWSRSGWRLLVGMVRAYARIFSNGVPQVIKVARLVPRTAFALFYPLLFLLLATVAAAAAAGVAALTVRWLAESELLAVAGAVLAAWQVFAVALRIERRLDTALLARIYAFVSRYAVGRLPELDHTIADAAQRIVELVRRRASDEVLVVGYSVGSILATRALAQALEQLEPGEWDGESPRLGLLTLGNCIPLLGLFPQAHAYRMELALLAESDRIDWVDVSAPTDWGAFPLLNPLDVCEVRVQRQGRGWPVMTSPRFHTLFDAASYQRMIRDKHQVHTQYLLSTEKPGRYDFFEITAGTGFFRERYAAERGRRR